MACKCEELAGGKIELSSACLGHMWMFEDMGPEEMEALSQAALRRKYQAGQVIFRQGDPADTMFLIKGGRTKLTKLSEDGLEIILDIRKAGDFLGENMLNQPGDFPVSAVCLEDTLTCGFSQKRFEDLVLKHPKLGLQVIKNLSRRIDWLFSRVGSMSYTNLEERLYQVLVNVAREHGAPAEQGLVISMPFTHEELSFLAGAHRVSITRAMKGLKESGRVQQMGKHLVVTHEASLPG